MHQSECRSLETNGQCETFMPSSLQPFSEVALHADDSSGPRCNG